MQSKTFLEQVNACPSNHSVMRIAVLQYHILDTHKCTLPINLNLAATSYMVFAGVCRALYPNVCAFSNFSNHIGFRNLPMAHRKTQVHRGNVCGIQILT